MISTLRDKGNTLAKSGKWTEALVKYTKAIDTIETTTETDLQVVLHTNRALCHLKLNNLLLCETDCTTALDLPQITESRAIKALFRRAQARATMEPPRLASALKDLKSVLSMDVTNKSAKKLWQQLTEKVRQQPAPVIAALDKLRLGSAVKTASSSTASAAASNSNKDQESGQENKVKATTTIQSTSDEDNTKLLRWILGQTFDETEAKELVRKNVITRLFSKLLDIAKEKQIDVLHSKDVSYAIRSLASLRNHPSLHVKVCNVIGGSDTNQQERTTEAWCWIIEHCSSDIISSVLFCCEGIVNEQQNFRRSKFMSSMIKCMNTAQNNHKSAPTTTSTTKSTTTSTTKSSTAASAASVSASIDFNASKICSPILRALVKWVIVTKKVANEFTETKGVESIITCADPEDDDVRGMVALCLGRVFSMYGDDNVVKERVRLQILPLLHMSKGALINANGCAALLCVFMVSQMHKSAESTCRLIFLCFSSSIKTNFHLSFFTYLSLF